MRPPGDDTGTAETARIHAFKSLHAGRRPFAQATGRIKTFDACEAILQHLDDLGDLYLAEQRLIEQREGRDRTYPREGSGERPSAGGLSSRVGPARSSASPVPRRPGGLPASR